VRDPRINRLHAKLSQLGEWQHNNEERERESERGGDAEEDGEEAEIGCHTHLRSGCFPFACGRGSVGGRHVHLH
jgi:hypothetical protein